MIGTNSQSQIINIYKNNTQIDNINKTKIKKIVRKQINKIIPTFKNENNNIQIRTNEYNNYNKNNRIENNNNK